MGPRASEIATPLPIGATSYPHPRGEPRAYRLGTSERLRLPRLGGAKPWQKPWYCGLADSVPTYCGKVHGEGHGQGVGPPPWALDHVTNLAPRAIFGGQVFHRRQGATRPCPATPLNPTCGRTRGTVGGFTEFRPNSFLKVLRPRTRITPPMADTDGRTFKTGAGGQFSHAGHVFENGNFGASKPRCARVPRGSYTADYLRKRLPLMV